MIMTVRHAGVNDGSLGNVVPIRDPDTCAGHRQFVEPIFFVKSADNHLNQVTFFGGFFEMVQRGDALHATQGIGHSVDGKKRPYMDHIPWVALATTAYLPATSAPVAVASDGLPVSIQIVGPFLGDYTTIRFAELLADVRGGFVPHPAL